MKIRNPRRLVLGALMILCATDPVSADGVDLHQVLPGPARCDHVMDLMMRYGIHDVGPHAGEPLMHHSPLGSMWVPHEELGDLELVEVVALPMSDPACGPSFAVVVQNNSKRDVCGFHISVVALLGRITPFSPTAVVKVDTLCAGQASEVHVQLPVEALAMGQRSGQPVEFTHLVVAIDSFDQFAECNEANNIKVLDRTAIPLREITVQTTEIVPPEGDRQVPETITGVTSAVVGEATPIDGIDGATAPQASPSQTPFSPDPSPPFQSPQPPVTDDLQSAINRLDRQNTEASENQASAMPF